MPAVYWQTPFRSIAGHAQMIEYVVLDITPLGPTRGKFVLADVMVARSRDLGNNDTQFFARTHLGHILRAGDTALGYDPPFLAETHMLTVNVVAMILRMATLTIPI